MFAAPLLQMTAWPHVSISQYPDKAVPVAARLNVCSFVAAFLCFIVALGPFSAEAVCLPSRQQARPNDPYTYISIFISSLSYAKQGLDRASLKPSVTDLLMQLKLAQEDYRCADLLVKPFVLSTDETIALHAVLVSDIYLSLVELNNHAIADIVTALDRAHDPGSKQQIGSLSDRAANLRVLRDELFQTLMSASMTGMYVLLSFDGPNQEATGRLRITEAQRRHLMNQLEGNFGPAARTGPKPDKAGTVDWGEGTSNLIYSFLADRPWRSADEPMTRIDTIPFLAARCAEDGCAVCRYTAANH